VYNTRVVLEVGLTTHRRLLAIAAIVTLLAGACQSNLVPPLGSLNPSPSAADSASRPPSSPSTDIFAVTGLEAERIASVMRFVTAFNAARLDDASAVFADDAALNDCDFASHEIIEARGRAAIRAWLVQRFADHDRLVIARIFNMNPDPNSNQSVGVEFALRTSDTIARLGAPNGLVPQGEAKVVFDPTGQRITTFANAPGGAPVGVVLNMCSVPTPTGSPVPTSSG
jgi:hypothetical protein